MTAAPSFQLTYSNNETWIDNFAFTLNGAARDLTGWSLRMQLRAQAGDPNIAIEASTANSRLIITNGPGGNVQIFVAVADTQNIAAGNYTADIVGSPFNDARVYQLAQGFVVVTEGVTR